MYTQGVTNMNKEPELEINIDVNRLPKYIGIKDNLTGLRIISGADKCKVINWVTQQLPENNDCKITVKLYPMPTFLAYDITAFLFDKVDRLIYTRPSKDHTYVVFDRKAQ